MSKNYTYDRNGNRTSKTTPWGSIYYEYDPENRLARRGDIVYTNDKDGNVLSEKGLRYEAWYEYNGQNRMVNSVVTNHVEKTHVVSSHTYDALGRRTLSRSVTGETLRTLYDGQTFEVIREGESFKDGSLTTRSAQSGAISNATSNQVSSAEQPLSAAQTLGERYRWVGDSSSGKATSDDGYTVTGSRYGTRGVTLYGNGEAVAMSSSTGSRATYLGKDKLGSVRSVTTENGTLETSYEYDAFGQPYKGDLSGGMNLGYTGKPFDTASGLYNYGYRDYKPQTSRFTTVDPIRDGNNWFAYVNNDPVNYTDPWGLLKYGLDLNLYSGNSSIGKHSKRINRPDYAYVIGAHGNETSISNNNSGIKIGEEIVDTGNITVAKLTDLMHEYGYQDGQVVILSSCNTGKDPGNGEACFAQQLANELAKSSPNGIGIVLAPDNYINISITGAAKIGSHLSYFFNNITTPRSSFLFGDMRVFIGKNK